jgi:hypothetical protein
MFDSGNTPGEDVQPSSISSGVVDSFFEVIKSAF